MDFNDHKTGRGHHWSASTRQHITHCVLNLNLTEPEDTDTISNTCFLLDQPNKVYLRSVVRSILKMNDGDLMAYILGPLKRGGNERKLSVVEVHELIELRNMRKQLRLGSLTQQFNQRFAFPLLDGVSERTVGRAVKRAHISRKESTLVSIGANPEDQVAWLDRIAHVESLSILDMDEKSASRDNLRNKWAWSLVGQEANVDQQPIEVLGYSFSIISIYTQFGFLVWRIYEGTITSLEVEDFLRQDVDPLVQQGHFLILDNAANHGTLRVRNALEDIFQGRFDFCPPYSYDIKPCEKGFSMVTAWLRDRSDNCITLQDAIDLIDEGFQVHSTTGEYGSRAFNHFSQLQQNHFVYLEDGGV